MKRVLLRMLFICSVLVFYAGSGLCQHEHSNYLERERQRYLWQEPQRVMNEIGVEPGMVIGDVGAGEGYFTMRLAERVGDRGRVYANEVDKKYLTLIEVRCEEAGLGNVTTVLGTGDAPGFPPVEMDMIFMVNVYHFLEDPVTFLQNTKKGLKPEGELVIIQWDSEKMALENPDMPHAERVKYAKKPLLDNVQAAGYKMVREETFLSQQNIYICLPGE